MTKNDSFVKLGAAMLELREIFDNFNEGFACWTPERRLLQANAAFLELTGLKTGTSFSEIPDADALSPSFAELANFIMQHIELHHGVLKNFELHLPYAAGTPRWVKIDACHSLGADGKTRCYSAYLTDITSLKLKEAELSHLAFYDTLTGLPNRLFFISKIAAALHAAKRYPEQFGLICVDLDSFSSINQHYGRDFGDMLLRHTATTLLACCRSRARSAG